MKYIVFLDIVVYVLDLFSSGALSAMLCFSPALILRGQIWRLITFVFLPLDANPILMVISLYFYWFIGTTLERQWGSAKFTVFYGMGVLLTLIVGFILDTAGLGILINMFYVNMSMFFAFASLYPDMRLLLFFLIPIKVKWLAWLDLALFAFNCIRYLTSGLGLLCLLPLVAVVNYLLLFWSDVTSAVTRTGGRVRHQSSRQTIHFKQATRQAQQQRGYIHKCAVCGKTDTEYPNEEFRYCSKCNGYYCYCSEHIHSHVHIE